jgi:hypothetical protein
VSTARRISAVFSPANSLRASQHFVHDHAESPDGRTGIDGVTPVAQGSIEQPLVRSSDVPDSHGYILRLRLRLTARSLLNLNRVLQIRTLQARNDYS